MDQKWQRPWIEAFRVGMHLLAHLATALTLIFVISLAQLAIRQVGDPRLLDFVPVRYIFDTMDLALLAMFLLFGIDSAYHAFKEESGDD